VYWLTVWFSLKLSPVTCWLEVRRKIIRVHNICWKNTFYVFIFHLTAYFFLFSKCKILIVVAYICVSICAARCERYRNSVGGNGHHWNGRQIMFLYFTIHATKCAAQRIRKRRLRHASFAVNSVQVSVPI